MGQGTYQAVVFGAIDPDIREEIDGYSEIVDAIDSAIIKTERRLGVRIKTPYECRTDYLGVVLAVSDESLAHSWKAASIPDRSAMPLGDLPVAIEAVVAEPMDKAREAWQAVRDAAAKAGKSLPDGRLLFVGDYD